VRLPRMSVICVAPLYICEELLRDEGFTDIGYVDISLPELIDSSALGSGRVDFAAALSLVHVFGFDAGAPITVLSGVHVGCYELFAHGDVRTIAADTDGNRPEIAEARAYCRKTEGILYSLYLEHRSGDERSCRRGSGVHRCGICVAE
jgi:hypothetical protein